MYFHTSMDRAIPSDLIIIKITFKIYLKDTMCKNRSNINHAYVSTEQNQTTKHKDNGKFDAAYETHSCSIFKEIK